MYVDKIEPKFVVFFSSGKRFLIEQLLYTTYDRAVDATVLFWLVVVVVVKEFSPAEGQRAELLVQ